VTHQVAGSIENEGLGHAQVRATQRGCQVGKECLSAFRGDTLALGIHRQPRIRHPGAEVVQKKQKVIGNGGEHDDRWVDTDLEGVRVLPHQR
jgi:hypothetical protein